MSAVPLATIGSGIFFSFPLSRLWLSFGKGLRCRTCGIPVRNDMRMPLVRNPNWSKWSHH